MRRLALAAALAMIATPAAAQTVQLYAAGSLRAALTEVVAAFGGGVEGKFGPSGTLKDEIAGGARADLFASANMAHPQALAAAGRSGPVVLFARNRLCALARSDLAVTTATLLERMLDAGVKLGTSTPKADPSGDYAWEVFRKADALKPGAFALLDKKALQLVGGPASPAPPPGRTAYGALVAQGAADLFLTYCTNARAAQAEEPGQQVVALPEALTVGADYGLTVMREASATAHRLALFILSRDGQAILARHGFAAPTLP